MVSIRFFHQEREQKYKDEIVNLEKEVTELEKVHKQELEKQGQNF